MKKKLAFLHTLEANVAVFGELVRELGGDFVLEHRVDDSLLKDIVAEGSMDDGVEKRVQANLRELLEKSPDLVVCTCSSIGSVAESMNATSPVEIQRIDRAMTDQAVEIGERILLAATLPTTLRPTRELLESSARLSGKSITIKEVVISDAWKCYESKDLAGYATVIAKGLEDEIGTSDVIVLAQASMAEAAHLVADCPIPILSSPRLGVERAIEALG